MQTFVETLRKFFLGMISLLPNKFLYKKYLLVCRILEMKIVIFSY